MIEQENVPLIDWLLEPSIDRSIDWLIVRAIDWLIDCWSNRSIDWLIDWLIDCSLKEAHCCKGEWRRNAQGKCCFWILHFPVDSGKFRAFFLWPQHTIKQEEELYIFDRKIVLAIDNLLTAQQKSFQQLGIPGMKETSASQDILKQMVVIDVLSRLAGIDGQTTWEKHVDQFFSNSVCCALFLCYHEKIALEWLKMFSFLLFPRGKNFRTFTFKKRVKDGPLGKMTCLALFQPRHRLNPGSLPRTVQRKGDEMRQRLVWNNGKPHSQSYAAGHGNAPVSTQVPFQLRDFASCYGICIFFLWDQRFIRILSIVEAFFRSWLPCCCVTGRKSAEKRGRYHVDCRGYAEN